MRQKLKEAYMKNAEVMATCSYARRLQVAAIIVKNERIISIGYNGTPAGWDNNCEDVEWCSAGGWLSPEEIIEGWPYEGEYLDSEGNTVKGRYRLKTKKEVLHAESNAIAKLAKHDGGGDGADIFITHAPCMECSKLIYQSGIRRVFYRNSYRNNDGVEFLKASDIHVEQM
jgi:dCMP deaminase